MHGFRPHFAAAAVLVICGLSVPRSAEAQTSTACSTRSADYSTCVWIADASLQVGETVAIEAWLESRAQAWIKVATTISLYNGNSLIVTHATDPQTKTFRPDFIFTSPGQIQLFARPSPTGPDSPVITVNVFKFSPVYTTSFSAAGRRVGQSLHVTTDTRFYKPNGGTLVFYVKPPGGTATEYARKTINLTSTGYITDHDERDFTFKAPYNLPGEYIFQVGYLGDTLNAETRSDYFRVNIESVNPALIIPIITELLLGN